jgi:hypothetical protein
MVVTSPEEDPVYGPLGGRIGELRDEPLVRMLVAVLVAGGVLLFVTLLAIGIWLSTG